MSNYKKDLKNKELIIDENINKKRISYNYPNLNRRNIITENTRNIGSFYVYIIPYYIDKYNECHVLMGKKNFEYTDPKTGKIGLNNNPLQWIFIGGSGGEKINKNTRESISESILREFKEEVGYKLKNRFEKIFIIEPKYEKNNKKIYTCLYQVTEEEFDEMRTLGEYVDGKKEIIAIKWIKLRNCIYNLRYNNLPNVDEFYRHYSKSKLSNISSLFKYKTKVNWHYHAICEFKSYLYNPYFNFKKFKKCSYNNEPKIQKI